MGSLTLDKQCLSIIIVGAGIGGLATATALSQKGHKVTILERHHELHEFGASIGITSNGVRCLDAMGLRADFEKVVTKNKYLLFRDVNTNQAKGHLPLNVKHNGEIRYGEEFWSINRQDYQNVLADSARDAGAQILFSIDIDHIDVDDCIVYTRTGEHRADVIVGADGMKSVVRKSIPATSNVDPTPWAAEQCYRCTVPKERMRDNPVLRELLESGSEMAWLGDGKYILAWPLPDNRPYDVVLCIIKPGDIPVGRWGTRVDPEEARKELDGCCPQIVELFKHVDHSVKWTLGDLPPLATCRGENGRVVLLGDAFHAMIPHSASGGNSAVEDAACLAECLEWAAKEADQPGRSRDGAIALATKAFEDMRKPRVERMQEASREGYLLLGGSKDFNPIRDAALRESTEAYDAELELSEPERRKKVNAKADMHARFPLEPYLQWLYPYDTVAATRQHLSLLG